MVGTHLTVVGVGRVFVQSGRDRVRGRKGIPTPTWGNPKRTGYRLDQESTGLIATLGKEDRDRRSSALRPESGPERGGLTGRPKVS